MNSNSRASQYFEDKSNSKIGSDLLFTFVFIVSILFFIVLGLYLKTVKQLPKVFDNSSINLIRTQFYVKEKKKAAIKKIPPINKEQTITKAIDLTDKNIVLAQKENNVVEKTTTTTTPVKQVYGLRRVFSVGLGSGGTSTTFSDVIIGKKGNTINKDFDTLKASEKELKGEIASVTVVTSKPVIISAEKPEYTDIMKENRVTGVVSVRILVDVDGLVKQVVVLNDLGFGTKEAVEKASRLLKFKPAMEGDKAVATWIVFKFRFVLQE